MLLDKAVDNANSLFKEAYKNAQENADVDIEKVLFSEDNRILLRYP